MQAALQHLTVSAVAVLSGLGPEAILIFCSNTYMQPLSTTKKKKSFLLVSLCTPLDGKESSQLKG